MRAIFNNTLHLNKTAVNVPFMIEQTPIGIVTEVNEETYTVEIWDKFVGCELMNGNVSAVYFSDKEQYTYDEFIKLVHKT